MSWRRVLSVVAIVIASQTCSHGGHLAMYEVAVLDFDDRELVFADFESMSTTSTINVTDQLERAPVVVAAGYDGTIYVASDDEPGQLAVLDSRTRQWTVTEIIGGIVPNDLDARPDGGLMLASELGIYQIDPQTGESDRIRFTNLDPTGFFLSAQTRRVEVTSTGSVVSHNRLLDDGMALISYDPAIDESARIDVPLVFEDYVLEADSTLLGNSLLADPVGSLYRVALDTGNLETISDDGSFTDSFRLALDEDGRILALKVSRDGLTTDRLLRLDLATGETDEIDLNINGAIDLALVPVIPEPSACLLFVVGLLLLVPLRPAVARRALLANRVKYFGISPSTKWKLGRWVRGIGLTFSVCATGSASAEANNGAPTGTGRGRATKP